mgnify:CR=1 FL=1
MFHCNKCRFYCHIKCSKLQDVFPKLQKEEIAQLECSNCVMKSKNLNELVRENCESYENIHQIMMRHNLLGFILKEIFAKMREPLKEWAQNLLEDFVNENQDFFKYDEVMLGWLNVIEIGVWLENEDEYNMTSN